jgi:hypothetical protein
VEDDAAWPGLGDAVEGSRDAPAFASMNGRKIERGAVAGYRADEVKRMLRSGLPL